MRRQQHDRVRRLRLELHPDRVRQRHPDHRRNATTATPSGRRRLQTRTARGATRVRRRYPGVGEEGIRQQRILTTISSRRRLHRLRQQHPQSLEECDAGDDRPALLQGRLHDSPSAGLRRRPEGDGEQCDDGATADCDGCFGRLPHHRVRQRQPRGRCGEAVRRPEHGVRRRVLGHVPERGLRQRGQGGHRRVRRRQPRTGTVGSSCSTTCTPGWCGQTGPRIRDPAPRTAFSTARLVERRST